MFYIGVSIFFLFLSFVVPADKICLILISSALFGIAGELSSISNNIKK